MDRRYVEGVNAAIKAVASWETVSDVERIAQEAAIKRISALLMESRVVFLTGPNDVEVKVGVHPAILEMAQEAGEREEARIGGIVERNPVLRRPKYQAAIASYLVLAEQAGLITVHDGKRAPPNQTISGLLAKIEEAMGAHIVSFNLNWDDGSLSLSFEPKR